METIMAVQPVPPGAAPANPAAHQPSRRALLGALAVAPIVAAPATAHALGSVDDVVIGSDVGLVRAWDVCRADPEADGDYKLLGAAENILDDTPAISLAGVEAKLRMAAFCIIPGKSVDREVLGPVGSRLSTNHEIDDYGQRLLFRALADVRRIAGEA
jgi:hypothetical protein